MEKPNKTTKVMDINQKLSIMQTKFKSKKSRFNNFGKYNFRSAEDILEAIKPFLLELDVTVTINETLITDMAIPVIQSDARISDGKNAIHATAVVGVDLNQKGMQTPQQFGSASSYAKKYSLGNLLLIDDTQDSDSTNNHSHKELNELTASSDNFKKAKDYIKSGGTIGTIKSKYKMSKEVESALLK